MAKNAYGIYRYIPGIYQSIIYRYIYTSIYIRRRYRRTRHHAVIVYEFIAYVGAESRENRQHYDRVEELSLGLRQTSRSLGLGDVDKPSEILSLSL